MLVQRTKEAFVLWGWYAARSYQSLSYLGASHEGTPSLLGRMLNQTSCKFPGQISRWRCWHPQQGKPCLDRVACEHGLEVRGGRTECPLLDRGFVQDCGAACGMHGLGRAMAADRIADLEDALVSGNGAVFCVAPHAPSRLRERRLHDPNGLRFPRGRVDRGLSCGGAISRREQVQDGSVRNALKSGACCCSVLYDPKRSRLRTCSP